MTAKMKRREFITLLGAGAAAWPLAARAQQPKVWRIGVLAPVPPMPAAVSAFRDGMRARGYVEGQNRSIDVRWPQGTFEHVADHARGDQPACLRGIHFSPQL